MRDTKQPGLQGATIIKFIQLAIAFEHRLWHHIFAVHNGARHAGTVAVQAGTKSRESLQERLVTLFEAANVVENLTMIIANVEFHASAYRTCPAPMVLLAARLHTFLYVLCRIENSRCSGESDCRKSCASKSL